LTTDRSVAEPLAPVSARASIWTLELPKLRRSEWLLFAFFVYMAALAQVRGAGFPQRTALLLLIPLALVVLARADSHSTGRVWSMARDWVAALLVLIAYWSADWVPQLPNDHALENALIGWDRTLLNDWAVRSTIERFGGILPASLELSYLLVYSVPPLVIAYFYIRRERRRLDDFLFPFLLATLMTYSLLPHFPSEAPRVAFANTDLPTVDSVFRRFNLWILNHGDIRASVFPSGHVTVIFSAAFAMLLAVPERRAIGWTLLGLGVLVLINTVYARYHYAADGLAGIAVSLAGLGLALAHGARTGGRQA
jgi:membrane-associated phospholipid phosphatase